MLLDLSLPDSEGMNTFLRARAEALHAPIVVLTGVADEEVAARAVREGAQDYLVKAEVDGPLLYQSIRYAVERHASDEAIRRQRGALPEPHRGSIQGVMIQVGRHHPPGQPGPGLDARPRARRGADRPADVAPHRAGGSRDGAGLPEGAQGRAARAEQLRAEPAAARRLRGRARLHGVVDRVGGRPGDARDRRGHDRAQAGRAGPAHERGAVPADCREHQGGVHRRRARRLPAAVSEPDVGGDLGPAARGGLSQSGWPGCRPFIPTTPASCGEARQAIEKGEPISRNFRMRAARRHDSLGAGARLPRLQRQPRALSRGGPRRGHHGPAAHRGAAAPGAEDGGGRPAGGRRGPRLQQPAHRHPGLQRARAPGPRARSPVGRTTCKEIRAAGAERREPDAAAAGLQPPADPAAADARPEHGCSRAWTRCCSASSARTSS